MGVRRFRSRQHVERWAREVLAPSTAPTVRPSVEAVDRVVEAVYGYAYDRGRRELAERVLELLGLKGVMELPD